MVVIGMGGVLMIDHTVMILRNHVVSFFCNFLYRHRLSLLALLI